MKKTAGNKTVKKAVIAGAALLCMAGAGAIIKETTWGDTLPDGFREGAGTGTYTPARNAFDGDTETYWGLGEGEKKGFAERYFSEERDIESIDMEMSLAEGSEVNVYWEKEGTLIPYETGKVRGPVEGKAEILLPEDVRKTRHVVFSLEGEDAGESRIYEIRIKERSSSERYGKIVPESYSFNQKEYINLKPERLWNGMLRETWYEPLWYTPWEIQQSQEGREDDGIIPPFTGYPPKEGEIIWELDGQYRIETLKAYFDAGWRDIAFEFWDGNRWTGKTAFHGNSGNGWYRKDITGNSKTDRIRITFPAGWENARFIKQIEVWGEGVPENTERKVLFEKDEKSGTYRASAEGVWKDGFEAEVITEGNGNGKVTLTVNRESITASASSYESEGRSIYRIEADRDMLREGTQFLEINTYGKTLESITIRKTDRSGKIRIGNSDTDGYAGRPYGSERKQTTEKTVKLDRKYEIEKVRIYGDGGERVRIAKDERRGTWQECEYNRAGKYWEAELGGQEKNSIKIESDAGMEIYETEIYGSPAEDNTVSVEVWKGKKDTAQGSCIVGWLGDTLTQTVIDGSICPRHEGNLFWIPVNEAGRNYLKAKDHEITVTLNGKKRSRKYIIKTEDDTAEYEKKIKGSPLGLSIDLPYGTIKTQSDFITVSGSVGNGEKIKVFVNGTETEVKEDRYSTEVILEEGSQIITVTAEDETGRKAERKVEIIRDSTPPEIEIISPEEGEYINTGTAEFCVDGKEEGLWWQFNSEKWEEGTGRLKYKYYELEDGFYRYSVRAEDDAGNISETKTVNFCMDKTAPESFEIRMNVSGWTSNNRPEAEFGTTDATSGVARYEYRIDDNEWAECESPLQTETLKDGKRRLYVRATDMAGNIREESTEIWVDTSCPPEVENARPVPDEYSIFIKWEGMDDNSISDDELVAKEEGRGYRIERNPAWKDGVLFLRDYGYGKLEYEDKETIQGEKYSYRVWAVDRAGNESGKSEWKETTAGLASAEIEKEGETVIEFEGLMVTLPEGTCAEDIIRIQINEVPESALVEEEKPYNKLVGGIYSVTAVRTGPDGEYVTNHADLMEKATLEIGYSTLLLPEDYDENDIAVFYYDDLWGSWLSMKDCYIDREEKVVRVQTNHFTEFSVQASKKPVLTEGELREGAYSLSSPGTGHEDISVSAESGGVSVRFREYSLPGKNGLDFSVQRVYSTSTALEDSVDSEDIDIDGESVWKIADGWRINMPYMKWNGSSMTVTGTDGMTTSLAQMSKKSESSSSGKKTLMMESHEYSDLITELKFSEKGHRFLWWDWDTYSFDSAILYQGDGKKVYYGEDGKVNKITDSTGKNEITFTYGKGKTTVTDSYGRVIEFTIKDGLITEVKNGDRTVSYTTEKTEIDLTDKEKENKDQKKNVIRLTTAEDIGGRKWKYEYSTEKLYSSSVQTSPEQSGSNKNEPSRKHYSALSGITGPGIGYTKITYYITRDIEYTDEMKSSGKTYKYLVKQDKISAGNKTVWLSKDSYNKNEQYLRSTEYTLSYAQPVEKNIFVDRTMVYDGKTSVVTEYGTVRKVRNRLSQAPEAIRQVSDYNVSVADEQDEVHMLTYGKNVKTYAGPVTGGSLIQEESSEIDETFMRIKKSTTTKKEKNVATVEYVYDAKGNPEKETWTYDIDGRKSGKTVTRTYASNVTSRTNLPATVETESHAYIDGKEKKTNESEAYTYNGSGQVVYKYTGKEAEDRKSGWYYEYNEGDGQLLRITSPEKRKTEYTYNYPESGNEYTVKATYKSVKGIMSAAGQDVTEEDAYDLSTGDNIRHTDRDGYITVSTYDILGRLTEQKKFTEAGKSSDGDECAVTVIAYDDENLKTTVTEEGGCVTVNSFDDLGRLTSVVRTGNTYTKGSDESIEKSITTVLDYDSYDRVTKMSEASYESEEAIRNAFRGTEYGYDRQDRLVRMKNADGEITEYAYDDSSSTVTETRKKTVKAQDGYAEPVVEVKKTQTDANGKTIKESLYFRADGETEEGWKDAVHYVDGSGKELATEDAAGNRTTVTYNRMGLAECTEYPDGMKVTNTYDRDGNLTKTVKKGSDSTESETAYSVNAFGKVYAAETPVSGDEGAGKVVTENILDGRGNILSEKTYYKGDASDIREIKKTYDWNGNVKTETDGRGNTTVNIYDKMGNMTRVEDPRENLEGYTAEFFMEMEYDSFGRLVKGWLPQLEKRAALGDADVLITYDAQGNAAYRKELIKSDGTEGEYAETVYEYTDAGQLLSQTTDGQTTSYTYNGAGKVLKQTAPDGTYTEYEYDESGMVMSERRSGDEKSVNYTYDRNGNVKTKTDRNGKKTEYEYDSMNRKTSEKTDGKLIKKTEYDGLGRVKTETDGEKNSRTYEYDRLNRIKKETVNTVPETVLTYEYDARGNITGYTDANGTLFAREYTKTDSIETEKAYGKDNRPSADKDKDSPDETWTYKYDDGNALKWIDDGTNRISYNGAEGDYSPDAYGNTRSEYWSSTGYTMQYGYDRISRLETVTTPDGKAVTYAYNRNSQVTSMTGYVSGNITYENARMSSYTTTGPSLNKTYGYSEAGLISEFRYKKGSETKAGFSYTYDGNYNITERKSLVTDRKDKYSYDALNRLVRSELYGKFLEKENESFSLYNMKEIPRDLDGKDDVTKEGTVNAEWFPTDRVILDEKGKSYAYDFGKEKEVTRVELFKTNQEVKSRIRERDLHLYFRNAESGDWTEIQYEEWKFSTDGINQSIRIDLRNSVKCRFIKIRTIWDDRNFDDESISRYATFTNDSIQNMLRIWTFDESRTEQYEYDGNSNRTSLTVNGSSQEYEYYKNEDGGNTALVKNDGEWFYAYDPNGNRTLKARALDKEDETKADESKEWWTYEWDLHNRLVKAEQHNAPDSAACVKVEYAYDTLNRMLERKSSTKNADSPEVTHYAYGRNGALTYEARISGESIMASRTYAYLNDQIIGFTEKTSTGIERTCYTVTDITGTVTEVYDSDGNLLWKENYTAFGKASGTETDEFDEAFGFSAMFTGCQEDRETGLSYHWNRWRSEDGSSFITQDPARDGSNWYGYCGQNPVNYKDPTGLAYYGPDGVHSSSEAPTTHGEPNKNVTPSVPDTSAMPQNLNILLVPIDDAEAIDKAVNAYFGGLKDGVAGNAPVDGIGLVDMNGNTIHIFTNDESISKFNEALGYNAEPNWTNAAYASETETFENQNSYNRGTNITIGCCEVITGLVVWAGTVIAAGAITVATEGAGTYFAGMQVGEGFALGAFCIGYGFARITNNCNGPIFSDIVNAVTPIEVDIAKQLNEIPKEKQK